MPMMPAHAALRCYDTAIYAMLPPLITMLPLID